MAFRLTSKMLFKATPPVGQAMNRWAYNLSGFNKYGLINATNGNKLWYSTRIKKSYITIKRYFKRDDCLYETEDVKEALRRLPGSVRDERTYRMLRAIQLSGAKIVLPKHMWTKYEEDQLYLSPIVEQVRREREEREKWEQEY